MFRVLKNKILIGIILACFAGFFVNLASPSVHATLHTYLDHTQSSPEDNSPSDHADHSQNCHICRLLQHGFFGVVDALPMALVGSLLVISFLSCIFIPRFISIPAYCGRAPPSSR